METTKEKIPIKKANFHLSKEKAVTLIYRAVYAVMGFMLSSVSFDGEIFPFGMAFAGGCDDKNLLFTCVGSAAGAVIFSPHTASLKYVCSVILIFFLRTSLSSSIKENHRLWAYPAITVFSSAVCTAAVELVFLSELPSLVLQMCEILISGACTLFSYRLSVFVSEKNFYSGISPGDAAAVMLWSSLLFTSVKKAAVFGFSPARFSAFLLIMLICYCGKEKFGTMAGICSGVVFGLAEETPQLLFSLPLCGLLCGLFAENGKITVAVTFAVVNTLSLILRGNPDNMGAAVAEFLSAALIFGFVPEKALRKIFTFLSPFFDGTSSGSIEKALEIRTLKSANAVRDMAYSVEAVCRMLSRVDKPDLNSIPDAVKDDVCNDCLKYDYCWKRTGGITKKSFFDCLKTAEDCGRLTPETIPDRLSILCREKNALCDSFNRLLCEHSARLTVRNELFETKALTAAQYFSAADIIEDAVKKAVNAGLPDKRLTYIAERLFSRFGFEISSLTVNGEKKGCCVIEACFDKVPEGTDYNFLLQRLETATDIKFQPPVIEKCRDGKVLMNFCEKTPFYAEYYRLSRTGDGEKLCGDNSEVFFDGKGKFFCVLSDGMGTGSRAALDSVMTCSLFSKLMKAGFNTETAFSTVNTALAVKSADESLATLDMLIFDMFTGEAVIYKAGGALSVIFTDGVALIYEQSTMPLGILTDTNFDSSEFLLQKGDAVLMISDGALPAGSDFLRNIFYRNKNISPEEICRITVDTAVKASPSGKIDDITAICIKIK